MIARLREIRRSGFSKVWLLMICSAFAFSATPLMVFVGSLVGADLAPSTDWSTLPLALMIVGTAVGIVPATQCMKAMGRKPTLMLFIGIGVLSCWLAGYGIERSSFEIFCIAAALLGFTNAALQQIRFAAMECVALEKGPTAASLIMCGGIVAAVLGPELAVIGRDLSEVQYQGSFWLISIFLVLAGVLLTQFEPVIQQNSVAQTVPRAFSKMLKNPSFCLAITSATVGYVVMAFVMTGTPISMHHHQGHSLVDTKWVIQSHIAAMFLPSLVSPWLFRLLGIKGMMVTGLICYGITITVGLLDSSVMGYWGQLVMLGVGWNFLFVSGTALLPLTYLPGEQYKAQAINDATVFSTQALAALSAGWALSAISWHSILLLTLVPMSLMLVVLFWNQISRDYSLVE